MSRVMRRVPYRKIPEQLMFWSVINLTGYVPRDASCILKNSGAAMFRGGFNNLNT
jgi:hypothetical protein